MKKILCLLLTIFLLSCTKTTTEDMSKKNLVIGISPGPYSVLFLNAVKPILEQQGYQFKLVNFTGLLESNIALNEGSVDFNVDQHIAYMQVFNQQRRADLANLVHIPSVPAAIFSNKFTDIAQIKPRAKIAIPQDPSNAARAYRILAQAKWIELKPEINPVLITKNDIIKNELELDITEVDSANIPRLLADVDFGVIPGSIVYAAKLDSKKALLQETLVPDLEISVTVKKSNLNSQWAQAIKQAYQSVQFAEYMHQNNQDNFWVMPK